MAEPVADLERLISDGFEAARRDWPGVSVPAEAFAEYVRARWSASSTAPSTERAQDLYLAFACARGVPEAIEIFESDLLARVAPAVHAMKQGPDFVDEVMQQAREQLLVRPEDGRPRIEEYAGLGQLRRWVRVVVVRIALQMMRDHGRSLPIDEEIAPEPAGGNLELEHLRAKYGDWFRQSIKRAFGTLSGEERRLLELHVCDGLSFSEIGERLGINKSTVSRRIATIRTRVFDETRRLAREELKVTGSEYHSLIQMIQSQLDVSLAVVASPKER